MKYKWDTSVLMLHDIILTILYIGNLKTTMHAFLVKFWILLVVPWIE